MANRDGTGSGSAQPSGFCGWRKHGAGVRGAKLWINVSNLKDFSDR